jgi:hypothetical protein
MSVVEEQAKELGVDAAGGSKESGQERDNGGRVLGAYFLN